MDGSDVQVLQSVRQSVSTDALAFFPDRGVVSRCVDLGFSGSLGREV